MIYVISADYRPHVEKHPEYYVVAKSTSEAKRKFQNKISWLKIYNVKVFDGDDQEILGSPEKYIILK
jgi:hypothetical protein